MNQEPQTVEEDEFDDEDADALLEADGDAEDEVDVDRALRDIEQSRRNKAAKGSDPAWRKLERMREERLTAELMMDLEDYDIGVGDDDGAGGEDVEIEEQAPGTAISIDGEDEEPLRIRFG